VTGAPGAEERDQHQHQHHDAPAAERVRRLESLLEQLGLVDGPMLDAIIDNFLANASPANGAKAVARAWVDDGFRQRLINDTYAAFDELGCTLATDVVEQEIRVVENTEQLHNVIVCTLCSCYPVSVLGPSPSWSRSDEYRARIVREPRAVLSEFGLDLPQQVQIRVWDSNAKTRYLVLPRRPAGTEKHAEAELAALVTRKGMVGTAAV
jgi:nitrile hydratase